MRHVKQIREIVEAGQTSEAHDALDQLLALGPNNTEALKLRARLFELEGRFVDEARVWDRVAAVDNEDQDAVTYLLRKQLEDREHFYFTDDLPGGGRRFLAYPRSLVNRSALGLTGCVAFLLASQLSTRVPALADPVVMLAMFTFFVISPWVGIAATYISGIKAVSLSPTGIEIATRLKVTAFAWADVEKVCLARSSQDDEAHLSLVILPKDRTERPVEIDLNQGTTSIRARSYLVREIARLHSEPECVARTALDLDRRKVSSF